MQNMSSLYPYITNTIVDILKVAIFAAFSLVIIPWLRSSAIPWLKDKQLYGIIQKFVQAAEKMGEAGIISKEDKLNYVVGLLERHGVAITPEIRALIESAVGALDAEFAKGTSAVVDEFVDDVSDTPTPEVDPAKPGESIADTIAIGAYALAEMDAAE